VIVPITFGKDVFNEGSSAQLTCMVTEGDEPLTITWSFHGADISSELGITTQNFGTRTSLLMISSVNHKHNGIYTCKANNKAGSSSSTTQLKVNGKWIRGERSWKGTGTKLSLTHLHPFSTEPPKVLPFTFGSSVLSEGAFAQLSCVVTEGDEPLSISWSMHGHDLSSDLGIITASLGPRVSSLMIQSVGHRHVGTYTCIASNAAGKVSYSANLQVNG